jgi:hypothetical protein
MQVGSKTEFWNQKGTTPPLSPLEGEIKGGCMMMD